jgi:hypothetical protein
MLSMQRHWKRLHEQPCPTSNIAIVPHKVDDALWDWICWLLSDDENLIAGLDEMVNPRESNAEDKRRNLETIESLITKQEKTIERLGTEMATHDKFDVNAFREDIKTTTDQIKALKAERELIIKTIERSEITEDVWNDILEMAARVRERLFSTTYQDKRWIIEILNVRPEFIVEGKKVSLAVCYDLPSSDKSIELREFSNSKNDYNGQLSYAFLQRQNPL